MELWHENEKRLTRRRLEQLWVGKEIKYQRWIFIKRLYKGNLNFIVIRNLADGTKVKLRDFDWSKCVDKAMNHLGFDA